MSPFLYRAIAYAVDEISLIHITDFIATLLREM